VARGDSPDAVITLLKQEQARRKGLEAERLALVERERLAALTAKEVSQELSGRVTDLRGLLASASIPKVRQVLRALGASCKVEPAQTAEARRGIRLVASGSYARVAPIPPIPGNVFREVVSPTGFERFTPLPERLATAVFEGVVWPKAA
jgi:hypothetical protein